jgi:acetyltransferase
VVSLGDMADVDFGDLLDYLAADTQSRAILLYMESVTHAAKFMSAARRAARAKPVIVVKAGRSATGAKAALSHTGALAGADAAYEAAFRRAGVLRVRELAELFSAAEVLARHPGITGERLAVLTNGGGAGVLAADHLGDLGGTLAALSQATRAALDAVLPATWSRGNPVDIIGDAPPERYARALEALLGADDADAVLVMNCPTALASSTDVAREVAAVVERHRASDGRKKAVFAAWLGDGASKEARTLFAHKHIGSFSTPAEAVDGYMQLVRHSRAQEQLMRTPPSLPADFAVDREQARRGLEAVMAAGRTVLSEIEAKELLAACGIATVPTNVARDPDEVEALAQGFIAEHGSAVVKILSDDISHKSDIGGVRLGLEHAAEAKQAAAGMLQRVARAMPDAHVKGFTVQPMVRRPRAHELILGMSVDDAFGPLLMFGAGGTAVEVVRDTAHALPPLDLELARDLMRHTRVWHLLQGYRDWPAANIDAIAQTLVRLSYLVAQHAEIREIDINPLLATPQGVVALDARIVLHDPAQSEADLPRPAIRPYPTAYVWKVAARDGEPLIIRPVRPDDESLMVAFHRSLGEDSVRLRYLHPFKLDERTAHERLVRVCFGDYDRELALVVERTAPDGGCEIVALGRLSRDPGNGNSAEFALLVTDSWQGRGVGRELLGRLLDVARQERIRRVYADILLANVRMQRLCEHLGFAVDAVGEGGIVAAAIEL